MQIHCDLLSKELARRGHEVTVVTTALEGQERESEARGNIKTIFLPGTPPARDSLAWLRRSAEFLETRADAFDVVFSESFAAAGYAPIRRAVGIPLVVCVHGFWLDYIRDQWREARGPVGLLKWLLLKIPEALWGARELEGPCVRSADALVAVGKDVGERLSRRRGISPARVSVIPNGVSAFAGGKIDRRSLGLPETGLVLTTACVLSRQKGVQAAITAFKLLKARVPDATLLIIGDGPAAAELKALAGADERIKFADHVPHDKVGDYLRASDVFLCPTLRREGLPFAALEALEAGLPVVASAVAGLREVVDEGKNGALVPAGDAGALASAIERLAADRARLKTMGEASRERFLRDYTVERMAERTLKVLENAATNR